MNRARIPAVVLFTCLVASAQLSADVRTDQRVRFQLGGAIGKLVNIFGGKALRSSPK